MTAVLPPGIIMKINMLQTLENFLNMYNLPALMLFREALDNALDIGATRIVIKFRKINGMYCISIEDNGPGIESTRRARVLERFYQVADGNREGSGLGLALVDQQMAIHNGTVVVGESELGGALVTLIFPIEKNNQS